MKEIVTSRSRDQLKLQSLVATPQPDYQGSVARSVMLAHKKVLEVLIGGTAAVVVWLE